MKCGRHHVARTTTSDTSSDVGKIEVGRNNRKGGRHAGTHHRPQPFQGALHGPAWPWEVLQSLPTIDCQRVREAAFAFRKRCAAQGMDDDIKKTLAKCFQFRLLNHWTEVEYMLWARQLVTMVKKKNGKLTMRGVRPIAMLPRMYRLFSKILQQLAGQAIHTRRSRQYGHVPGPDIMTPGIRRTRSVPQGDPCAADLFWSSTGHSGNSIM